MRDGPDGRPIRLLQSYKETLRRFAKDLEAERGGGPEQATEVAPGVLDLFCEVPASDGILRIEQGGVVLAHDVLLHAWPRLRHWQAIDSAATVPEPAYSPLRPPLSVPRPRSIKH